VIEAFHDPFYASQLRSATPSVDIVLSEAHWFLCDYFLKNGPIELKFFSTFRERLTEHTRCDKFDVTFIKVIQF
jgi:hypothetical protein